MPSGEAVEATTGKVRELERQVSSLASNNKLLTSQLEQLKGRWQEEGEQSGKLQELARSHELRAQHLEQQLAESQQLVSKLQEKLGTAAANIRAAKGRIDALGATRQDNLEKLRTLAEQLYEKQTETERLQVELEKSQTGRQADREVLGKLQAENREIKKEIARLQSLESTLGQSTDELSQKLSRSQELNESLRQELEEERQRKSELELRVSELEKDSQALVDLRDAESRSQQELVRLKEENARLEDEVKALESQLNVLHQSTETTGLQQESLQAELENKTSRLSELETEVANLAGQLEESQQVVEQLEMDLETSAEHSEFLERELESLSQAVEDRTVEQSLTEDLQQARHQLEIRSKELESARTQTEESQKLLQERETELADLRQELAQNAGLEGRLSETLLEVQEKELEVRKAFDAKLQENKSLQQQLASALDRAETSEVQYSNLQEELSRRIGRVTKLEAQLEALGNELQAYKNEVDEHRAQESAHESATELEKERLREDLRKAERDRDVQLQLVESRHKTEKERLESEVSTLRAKTEESDALLRHSEERARKAEARVSELEQEVSEPPVTENNAEVQELEAQIVELNEQLEELVAETGELSAAETIAMSRAARAERVAAEQTQTIESLRNEVNRLQSALGEKRDGEGQAAVVSDEREHLMAERIKGLLAELEEARASRRNAEEAFASNKSKVDDLNDQMELLRSALDEKDNEFQVIADALVEAEEAAAQLEKEKQALSDAGSAALRGENERLTMEMAKLRRTLEEYKKKEGARDNVESTLHSRDKEIEALQTEIQRLQDQVSASESLEAGDVNGSGSSVERVAELEAELALSQRKLGRLEQTIIRLKGRG